MALQVEEATEAMEKTGLEAIRDSIVNPAPTQPLKQGWEIPIIDFSKLRGANRRLAIDEIALACQEWGFFHVVNHGVPEKVIDAMWKAFDVLFHVPLDERTKFDFGPFVPPDILKLLSEKMLTWPKFGESRDTIRFSGLNPDDEGTIPLAPQEFRAPACEYYRSVRDVGFEVLDAISESIGMERDYIRKVTGNNPAINSSLHLYSPCLDGSKTIGLNPHRDIDTLTVLLQDEISGLQVLKDDRWVEVKPLPGSLVVNVGEAIQAMTNGKYQSVLHRVENKEKARLSISCFLLPAPKSVIEALPHFITKENPPLHPTCSWETFFYNYFAKGLKL